MDYKVPIYILSRYLHDDDLDGLVKFVKRVCSDAYQDGYTEGYTDGYHDACDNQD